MRVDTCVPMHACFDSTVEACRENRGRCRWPSMRVDACRHVSICRCVSMRVDPCRWMSMREHRSHSYTHRHAPTHTLTHTYTRACRRVSTRVNACRCVSQHVNACRCVSKSVDACRCVSIGVFAHSNHIHNNEYTHQHASTRSTDTEIRFNRRRVA